MTKAVPQEELKALVLKQFGIRVDCTLEIVPLDHTEWLSAKKWPRFTLLGQTFASVGVGIVAAQRFVPEVCFCGVD